VVVFVGIVALIVYGVNMEANAAKRETY